MLYSPCLYQWKMVVAGSEPAGSVQVTAGTITIAPAKTRWASLTLHWPAQTMHQSESRSVYVLTCLALIAACLWSSQWHETFPNPPTVPPLFSFILTVITAWAFPVIFCPWLFGRVWRSFKGLACCQCQSVARKWKVTTYREVCAVEHAPQFIYSAWKLTLLKLSMSISVHKNTHDIEWTLKTFPVPNHQAKDCLPGNYYSLLKYFPLSCMIQSHKSTFV